MAMTEQQLRFALSNEETQYEAIAAQLDESDLPKIAALANGPDTALATKAVYLASLLRGDQAHNLVLQAARSPNELVRIASATALPNLPAGIRDRVAVELTEAPSPSIAKLVLQAVDQPSPALQQRLQSLQLNTDLPELRELTRLKLQNIR